jgi:hypothetical protein
MIQIVKVNRDRGYGDGLWEVLQSKNSSEFNLQNLETKQKLTLFRVHRYTDGDTLRAQIRLQKERAAKIGRNFRGKA